MYLEALLGIGGGALTTPYLLWHQFDLRHAIATSAVCGVPDISTGLPWQACLRAVS